MIDFIGELRRIMNMGPGPAETYDPTTDSLEALATFAALYATIPIYEPVVEASVLMTGAVQILVAHADNKMGITDGWINLTPMQAGDTVIITQEIINAPGGAYALHARDTFNNAQALPMLYITPKTASRGIRVSIQQTLGGMRTFDVQFFRLREV